ncbi:MAG TPA: SCP2 sterol-binding domain-containing protein, partial [Conexibacter sp.]|nr:SCP2 sterol-binding domain-containing protein [Conexibacter sp.]
GPRDARAQQLLTRAQAALEGLWHEPPTAPGDAPTPAVRPRARRRASQLAAEGAARLLAHAPARLLALATREPLRRLLVPLVFGGMVRQVDTTKLDGLEAVIDWEVLAGPNGASANGAASSNGHGPARDGNGRAPDRWQLVIDRGEVSAARGGERTAALTMQLDALDLVKLATGRAAAPDLLVEGRLRAVGDLMLGPRFLEVVRIPQPSARR